MEESRVRSPYQPPQEICSLRVYPHGTITDRGHVNVQVKHTLPLKCRSAITTLSKASRSRLRRLLATTRGPDRWPCFGATLTIPGPPVTDAEWRRIFRAFRSRLIRLNNIALIWRIELQKRGQPHLHCICWGQTGSGRLRECWLDVLGLLGPYEGPADITRESSITSGKEHGEFKPGWASVTHRGLWQGAERKAVMIHGLRKNDDMGWWRYLAAHASKSKRSQLGWQGRQWGVVNRRLLDREESILLELPVKAMFKVLRCLQKIANCRFASGHGRQTWFVLPTTTKRLCEWAMAETYGGDMRAKDV